MRARNRKPRYFLGACGTILASALVLTACISDENTTTSQQSAIVITGSIIAGGPSGYRRARPRAPSPPPPPIYTPSNERYPDATANPIKITAREPVSTFSIDVDTTSYSNMRRYLERGNLPPADAVRVEELINYFDYSYQLPSDRTRPFEPTIAVYPTPWNPGTQILHVGIKGYDLPRAARPNANLVFLIDVSGSMDSDNKLPLLKRSFRMLVDELQPNDRVSLVTYASTVNVVLEPTPGSEKRTILRAINRLRAEGSTAGGEGIQQAYRLAKENFDPEGVNRVILATDGDFNVGITDPGALENYIGRERESGVYLTALGFGVGNYNDQIMQSLAQAGNGTAAYIDNLTEARKIFSDQISGTLFTIAEDVKIQVEFNPARIAEYRLIGYETRLLDETDFNNDDVDAGEVGSGHTVTALYEITPVGSPAQLSDPLRYGESEIVGDANGELAFVKLRYKLPGQTASNLIERAVADADFQSDFAALPADMRFAAAVASVGHLVRNDPYVKAFDFDDAIAIANAARGEDEFGYRAEFVSLLRLAESAESVQALNR